ncbi:TLC domain-containing protein 4-A-like [Patiria miniata]|uniref:TLC domain-containing protein n=1 Tax=Patiria miniata TaxID=46514 RepID=A0A913Z9T2_PATMI|nr:TLC domain-containing protein 4-A-like [Patiria miniata]XP_038048518.1 TLC domain-containing protein 4-A-like [Patiria miniata]
MESPNATEHQHPWEFSSEYLPALFASFLFFFTLMFLVSPLLSAKYSRTYKGMSSFDKANWNTRTVSNINAVIVSVLSIYLLVTDDSISSDKVWGTSQLARWNVCIICGFLIADLIVMLRWFPLSESWQYLIHHFVVLYPFLNNVVYGVLTFFANYRITTECSTLFVNLRWFMSVHEYKSNKWYVINGLMMTATFFLCRIAFIPLYYVFVYHDVSRAVATLPLSFIIAWLPSGMIMDVLNFYWCGKMYNGARKALWGTSKPKGAPVRNRVKGE